MRIRAIRMRELGCFSAPVALEGLSGELDVLAGPNELGKSTILKGLQALFTAPHTSQASDIRELRPYAGGAPLIEADFEAEGRLWRLRKQYLSEKQTLLTDVGSGKVAARGEEAHRRALELIGSGGAHRLGLLWLKQGSALSPAAKEGIREGAREELSRAIEREIAAASGGGHDLRVVRAKVIEQRRALVTGHEPPRPAGAYAVALASRSEAERSLEAARTSAGAAADRLRQVQTLRQRRAMLADPSALAAIRQHAQKLGADREAALAARQQLKIAEANVQACESRLAEAQQAFEMLARRLEEARGLEAAASVGEAEELKLTEALAELGRSMDEACARREELRRALDAERARLRTRHELDGRREAAARLAEVSARLNEAREAAARADEIRARLGEERVTEDKVAAAEREAAAVATLEARIAAQLPKVRVAYLPGASGKIRVEGRPVGAGEVLTPSRPVSFEIEGIGAITIEPAVHDVEEDEADLAAHRSVVADLLAGMDVPDLESARGRVEQRRRLERELARAEDRLATRAPEGMALLTQEAQRLAALSQGSGDDGAGLPERPEIEAEIERLGRTLREAEQAADRLARDHVEARERLAGNSAAARARKAQLTALAAELPPPGERAERLAEFETGLQTARLAVNEAIRERGAWRETAPDDAAMRALEAGLAASQQRERSAREELAAVERDLAVVERELERDRHDGITAKVKELEQRTRSLDDQVRHFERELSALDLLIEIVGQVEQQSRDLYLSPVLQRLDPYLSLVFPGARLDIGRSLDVETVARGEATESLSALSDGTQEQIAVIVRLAFARLLADHGRAAPLILDDALVYADDTRIESLFDALRMAAGAHQVIVFTCRARTFEQLGGTRLAVAPWAGQ
ncbi:MAG: hypothetical protein KJZ80_00890 [Hyphomicrobiaceae bacterium]|nr:hypothetical protein [Hyphomicrobiaceae bacterium]